MKTAKITASEFAGLQTGRIHRIHHERAALEVRLVGDERRFTMTGPSGKHSLLLAATDLDRLNAHWATFAGHVQNRRAPVTGGAA